MPTLDPIETVVALAARELGTPLDLRHDRSWAHGESSVVEVSGADGVARIVKQVREPGVFDREVRALRDLRDAFFDGYGRVLTDAEETMLTCIGAVSAVTTILWARAHADGPFEREGWRILESLRNAPNP